MHVISSALFIVDNDGKNLEEIKNELNYRRVL